MTKSTAKTNRLSPNGTDRFAVQGSVALSPARRTQEPAGGKGPASGKSALRVAPPAPVTVPRAPFVALILAVVVAGVMGILVLNTKINENAFRLADLHSKQSQLDEQEQQLNQQLANDRSPNSLYAAARRLGLVPAGTPAYLQLPDGRKLGVPQPATGTPSVTGQQSATAGH